MAVYTPWGYRTNVNWERVIRLYPPTPTDITLETPIDLPTSEPNNPQISITTSSNNLWSANDSSLSFVHLFNVYVRVRNTSSSSLTFSFKFLKNGTQVFSGSYSLSSTYNCVMSAFLYNVTLNDQIDVKLWASGSGIQLQCYAYCGSISRPSYSDLDGKMLYISYSGIIVYPSLTIGTSFAGNYYIYHSSFGEYNYSGSITVNGLGFSASYGFFKVYYGDINYLNNCYITSSSGNPGYYRNYIPTLITIRTRG